MRAFIIVMLPIVFYNNPSTPNTGRDNSARNLTLAIFLPEILLDLERTNGNICGIESDRPNRFRNLDKK